MKRISFLLICCFLALNFSSCEAHADIFSSRTEPLIIDHNCCDIFIIPVADFQKAKQNLVIAYGHTSHGSQIIAGMNGLDGFMAKKGYSAGTFDFNSDGSGGALQLHDSPFDDAYDLGNPDRTSWADATRNYLNNHSEVNVIMWSWCGQVSGASEDEIQTYLNLMNDLEAEFPAVVFVYMTGHLDGSGIEGQLNQRNNMIRKYCTDNKKVLFDFADIESFDPGGGVNYMELYCNDNCDYTDLFGNNKNWATEWQESHEENVDWYYCDAAHSQPLNGNRKAMAAWWMFANIAGWSNNSASILSDHKSFENFEWSIAHNYLNFTLNGDESVKSFKIFNILGDQIINGTSKLISDNAGFYSIPISVIPVYGMNKQLIFNVTTKNNNYSAKFILNKF